MMHFDDLDVEFLTERPRHAFHQRRHEIDAEAHVARADDRSTAGRRSGRECWLSVIAGLRGWRVWGRTYRTRCAMSSQNATPLCRLRALVAFGDDVAGSRCPPDGFETPGSNDEAGAELAEGRG